MKVQLVTLAELDERFERLLGAVETVGLRLSGVSGDGRVQEYFTREEAAEYLRMSVAKLDQLAARGEVRRAKLGDARKSSVLFRRGDLDTFVEGCLVQGGYIGAHN